MNYHHRIVERTIRPYPTEQISDFNARMQRMDEILQTYDKSEIYHRIEQQDNDQVQATVWMLQSSSPE